MYPRKKWILSENVEPELSLGLSMVYDDKELEELALGLASSFGSFLPSQSNRPFLMRRCEIEMPNNRRFSQPAITLVEIAPGCFPNFRYGQTAVLTVAVSNQAWIILQHANARAHSRNIDILTRRFMLKNEIYFGVIFDDKMDPTTLSLFDFSSSMGSNLSGEECV